MNQARHNTTSTPLHAGLPITWCSALAGLLVFGMVSLAWYALDKQQRTYIGRTTAATARSVESLIRNDLDGRVSVLTGLAERWRAAGGTGRTEWYADARNIVDADPGFKAIAWADRSLHLRWVEPIDGNEPAQDFDIRLNPDAFQAAKAASDSGAPAVTKPIELVLGKRGSAIYVPAYRGDQFDGLMVGVLEFDTWFNTLLPNALSADYGVTVSIDDKTVYSRQVGEVASARNWLEETSTSIYNLTWKVQAVPKADFLALVHTRSSIIILFTGLLLSALVSAAVYFGMTSRRRSRQIHEDSQHREILFQNLPGMAFHCMSQPPWTMDFVSEGCKALCGYEPNDFEQQRVLWMDLVHPEDREYVAKSLSEAVGVRKPYELEYRIQTRSGSERWMWERGAPVIGVSDKIVMLKGFITDITDRKRAESKLVAARSYSEAIVDAAHEAVITMGADNRIKGFSRGAQKIFGYPLEEAIGQPIEMLLHDIYHDEHRKYIQHFKKTGHLEYMFDRREMTLLRKDGSEFPAHVSVAEVRHQEVRQFVCLIRDISKEQAAEREAREHRENLAHADRLNMLGEMASGIAHEVNQPLTAISLFSQAGKRLFEAGKQEKLPEVFDKLSLHSQRAGAVIERMQTMARQHVSRQEVVDCNRLIREVATLAEAEARIRDIVIAVQLGDNIPPVAVDSVQIQQVALNLLRNGMEAMRSDGCRRGNTIEIKTRLADAGLVEISVTDSGCGVSDEAAKGLFTPFSTTKETGMGMGLSISQAIVTAHGGHIIFEKNSTGGAIFSFMLPAAMQGEEDG